MAPLLPIVAVLSATGTQGQAIVKTLSKSSRYAVRALTRDPRSTKAEELEKLPHVTAVDTADFDKAFKGVEAVYACTVTGPDEVQVVKNAADAAQRAGVKLFIFSSLNSVKEDTDGKIDYAYHHERKLEVEKYLKTLKVPSIVLHLSSFTDNFLKFDLLKYEKNEFTMVMNMAGIDTEHPQTYIGADLGNVVLLLLDNYEQTPTLFQSPIPVISYKMRFGDHAEILEKLTGRKVNSIVLDTFTGKESSTDSFERSLDGMRKYFDEYGMFKGKPLIDPRLADLGYKPHDFEHYVKEVIIPTFNL